MHQRKTICPLVAFAILTMVIGCESDEERLAQYVQQATAQQAKQNEVLADQTQAMARQSQEVTAAARDLAEQDANARRELIQAQERLQSQIHDERSNVNQQRDQLDVDRKEVATAAAREPVIAQSIMAIGLILVALLPLLVTAYAIRKLPDPCPATELFAGEILQELVGQGIVSAPRSLPPHSTQCLESQPMPPVANDESPEERPVT